MSDGMQGATLTNESTHGGKSNKKATKKKKEVGAYGD